MTNYSDHKEKGQKWLTKIKAADKREESWLNDAKAAEAAYSVDTKSKDTRYDFNILHSNVETIVPAIYNSTPVPDVRDRFSTGDKLAKSVADVFERVISAQIDDNKLDSEIEALAQDAFLTGRGIVRIRFDAQEVEGPETDYQTPDGELYSEPEQQVTGETVVYEVVSWRDYREGPAKRFADVPWVAFRHLIPTEELEEFEDAEMVAAQEDEEPATSGGEDEDIEVWEVWDKKSKTVRFIKDSDGTILQEQGDPLGLLGFFPIPKPVQPIGLTARRTPICPFVIYSKLADELDKTTKRINAIMSGLKVKGWVVGSAEDVEKLAQAGENELIPISGFEGLAQTGGIDKAIVWWPVEKAIVVIRELYVARDQTKQAIYEITGISDIIRGASQAQETATAQQLKTQWGSLRIKKMQRLIERQVRDLFVMTTELISSKFSIETIQKISGLRITDEMAQLIKDPLQRYRIDVESDTTVRADLTRIKGEMGELLQGTASYFATMAPVIEQAPEAAEPVAEIYASFARNFNIGQQGEAALEKLVDIAKQAADQPKPNPEAEAAKADAAKNEAQMGMEQQRMAMEGQRMKVEFGLKQQEAQSKHGWEAEKMKLDIAKLQIDREIKQIELQIKERELGVKERQQVIDTDFKGREIEIEKEQQRAVKVG